jgi:peptide/nickel transport system permease protein
MTRYIIRRTIQSVFLMLITTLIGFTIFQMAPGGPLQFMDDDPRVKQEDIARLTRSYGIDRSIPVQYVAWAFGEDWLPQNDTWRSGRCLNDSDDCSRGVIRLDFGRSFMFKGERVIDKITERIPATLWLALSSLLISMVVGFPLGVITALNRGRWPDNAVRVTTVLLNTVPEWWLGLLLLIILGGYLGLVPLGGMCDIGDCSWRDRLHHLILPATVSAIGGWIYYSRVLRFEMLEVLNQDYVRTAKAKGLPHNVVMRRHILRNALMPFVTGLSGIFLVVLSGAVIFENVFSWPGMGRLFIQAVNARDYPMMMASFVISGFLGILGLLMVDILYGFVDPRIKYE